MAEVQFTVPEVEKILGVSHETVLRYIRGHRGKSPRLHRAYLPYGSRSLGYRIPANDLLEFARQEGEWLVARVEQAIREKMRESDDVLQVV